MKVKLENMEMVIIQASGLLLTQRKLSLCRSGAQQYKKFVLKKRKTTIVCLMLIVCAICQAQKLDIKPYILYHQPVSSQQEPVFYDIDIAIPGGGQMFFASSFNKNFTLAKGLEYGFAVDYTFNNKLGVELGLDYFSSLSNSFANTEQRVAPNSCTTDWNYHSIGIRPLFTYSVMRGKSIFIGKIGPVVHYALASMDAFLETDKVSTCTFGNQLNLGYLIGLEYDYQLSGRLSLAMELGFEQYNYSPGKATVEYKKYNFSGKEKDEILYVDKMTNESQNQNERPKESVLFKSIYFGIGIKYNLWRK